MKNPADLTSKRLDHFYRLLDGVSLMNDTVETNVGSNFQMLTKQVRLFGFICQIISLGEFGLSTRQPVIVQTGLTQGDHLGMLCELPQVGPNVLRRLERIRRMPANCGKYTWESLGDFDGAPAAGEIGSDANDLRNSGVMGPFDYLRQLIRKIRITQMGMCVVERRHAIQC